MDVYLWKWSDSIEVSCKTTRLARPVQFRGEGRCQIQMVDRWAFGAASCCTTTTTLILSSGLLVELQYSLLFLLAMAAFQRRWLCILDLDKNTMVQTAIKCKCKMNLLKDRVLFLIASAQLWPTHILIPTLPSLSGLKERLCPSKLPGWPRNWTDAWLDFYPPFTGSHRFSHVLTSINPITLKLMHG